MQCTVKEYTVWQLSPSHFFFFCSHEQVQLQDTSTQIIDLSPLAYLQQQQKMKQVTSAHIIAHI